MRQVVNRRMMVSLMQAAYADPAKVGDVLSALQGSITTNIPVDTQVAWAQALAKDAGEITVYGTSGPFDGDIDEESQLFLVTLDPQNWKNLMAAVDSGQDPTAATEVYAAGFESPKAPIAQTFKISLQRTRRFVLATRHILICAKSHKKPLFPDIQEKGFRRV